MTTIAVAHPVSRTSPVDGRVTLPRIVAAELVKLRSVRSVVSALMVSALSVLALGALGAVGLLVSADRPEFDPLGGSLNGITLAAYVMAAVGVLAATGEYSGGTIRTTLAAVPNRTRLVVGKVVAVTAVVSTVALASTFGTFLVAERVLASSAFAVSWTAPGVLRALVGAALYLTVVALLGVGFGLLVRSTAGALTLLVGVLVLPPLFAMLLPHDLADTVLPLLPDPAGQAMMSLSQDSRPWTGSAVFLAYAVVTLTGATLLFRRRDA